ncbi:hypothetical protein KSP40_PGU000225 [Platanthera guangdongensis]|uniref:Transcription repressor n=1 Tax=Platanthera guangdongensis TaxID=2320717 RepID=A0ABR2MHD4_9ASPA
MRKMKISIKQVQEAITSLKQTSPIRSNFNNAHSISPSSSGRREEKPGVCRKDLPPQLSSASPPSQPTEGRSSYKRFFFSPCDTNSIMEELREADDAGRMAAGCFYEESEALTMVSVDPYIDFKMSMAEMVRAHEIREWLNLQELLHCYLRLNDEKNHKMIVLAFFDLVMQLMAENNENFTISSADLLCFCVCDLVN